MPSDHRFNASPTGLTMSTSGPLYQAMTVSLYTVALICFELYGCVLCRSAVAATEQRESCQNPNPWDTY